MKIRGTAAQIAEKYMLLARDASSSSDTVMAENYLQHAEHYNRIIMAAQAQAQAAVMSQHGSENGNAMNGSQRYQGDGNGSMRDQPQPHIHQHSAPQPQSQPQPHVQPAVQPQPQVQSNALEEIPEFLQAPVREPRKEAPKEDAAATGEPVDPARRRRKRYAATGTGRAGAAEGASPNGKAIEGPSEDHPTDEALI